jgi:hypothetical protein
MDRSHEPVYAHISRADQYGDLRVGGTTPTDSRVNDVDSWV